MSDMPYMSDNSSALSHEQVVAAYLQAMRLIDDRVTPFLGKVTTRVLVQGAAKRIVDSYPFLHFHEQLHAVSSQELAAGLNMLIQECFSALRELTGDLIVPPLHDEVTRQLGQIP